MSQVTFQRYHVSYEKFYGKLSKFFQIVREVFLAPSSFSHDVLKSLPEAYQNLLGVCRWCSEKFPRKFFQLSGKSSECLQDFSYKVSKSLPETTRSLPMVFRKISKKVFPNCPGSLPSASPTFHIKFRKVFWKQLGVCWWGLEKFQESFSKLSGKSSRWLPDFSYKVSTRSLPMGFRKISKKVFPNCPGGKSSKRLPDFSHNVSKSLPEASRSLPMVFRKFPRKFFQIVQEVIRTPPRLFTQLWVSF